LTSLALRTEKEEKNPAVRDENFADLAANAADPVRHRAFLMRTFAVRECSQKSSQNISLTTARPN
jgi:hypothetical protein